jgi:hypothetical protein
MHSSHSPLRPAADEVEPRVDPHSSDRAWPVRPQEPSPDGLEVPKGAYFVYPAALAPLGVTPSDEAGKLNREPPGGWPKVGADSVRDLDLSLLRPARGGRKPRKKQVMWEVIRSLTPEDIPLLNTTLPAPRATLVQIRHTHHQLARLLSEGRSNSDAALLTGYSPTYVSVLKDDPSFQELVAHYGMQEELYHVDVLERMKMVGLTTLDTLQERLEEDSSSFTNRELMEQAELMLVKPMVATRGGILPGVAAGPASNGVSINVNFIGQSTPRSQPEDILKHPAQNAADAAGRGGPTTIDVTPRRVDR